MKYISEEKVGDIIAWMDVVEKNLCNFKTLFANVVHLQTKTPSKIHEFK